MTFILHKPASRALLAAATVIGLGGSALALPAVQKAETVTPQLANCKPIRNAAQLQAMKNNLAGSYCLANDIDAGSIANFVPIGDGNNPFTGKLFGNGRVIRNLRINSGAAYVALFGAADNALIRDVGLVNADIVSTGGAYVGGLVGFVLANAGVSDIRRVYVTGRIGSTNTGSYMGGIVSSTAGLTLADSWSSAEVKGGSVVGGALGYASGNTATVSRVHATGPVICGADICYAGGLIGIVESGAVDLSYASGPVTAQAGSSGGLVGLAEDATIRRSHALGAVTVGTAGSAGGLIGLMTNSTLAQVYAVGRVAGEGAAMLGGLVGQAVNANSVAAAIWDTATSQQTVSAAGIGRTTVQLRNALPVGFGNNWAITAKRSYPFLDDADIDFAAPLATLVKGNRVYTFLPIGQRDTSQYAAAPINANAASQAAVYTMIARAIGIARNVAPLKEVTIDGYWKGSTKTAMWRGGVTNLATLGALTAIPANAQLNLVFGELRSGKLVMLRGGYNNNGAAATHWMLGTLYTLEANGGFGLVIAHDPWTGMQVAIDKVTKKVVWPANHPLTNFRINGYQPVTLN